MIITKECKAQMKEKSLSEVLKVLDPLPKVDGVTNFDLLKLEIGPLMLHLKEKVAKKKVPIFWIDLFSGAGGTTSGIHLAGNENVQVIACVNHDHTAIISHKANHPNCIHFVEDVRDFNVVLALKKLVDRLRIEFPGCIINIWASLECTNYSKAKGGLPRDADSRTLANALFMYLEQLNPDYLYIENVREFMAWGPLDENGRPISKKNGRDYIKWIKQVQSFGYDYDWQMLNAADFGAYTSRERYFGQFAKKGLPISWPETTHSKKPVGGLFEAKEKWNPVRDVLDLEDEGQSIFTRKKPLSENTLKRIYAGLVKFVAGGEDTITMVYNSGNDFNRVKSVGEPIGSLTTQNSHAVVKSKFLMKNFSGHPASKCKDLYSPAGSITCKDHHSIVQTTFLSHYYGNGFNTSVDDPCPTITTKERVAKIDTSFLVDYQYKSNAHGLDKPSPTLLTKDKLAKADVKFMDQQYGQSKPASIDQPTGTLTANPKMNLVSTQYLMNPSWGGNSSSIDKPSPVIVARQDKAPMYKVTATPGSRIAAIPLFESESDIMRQIKLFMAHFGISDIKMRMLKIIELLRIQGFPEDYELKGSKTDQKKFIGNAVVPLVAKMLCISNDEAIQKHFNNAA